MANLKDSFPRYSPEERSEHEKLLKKREPYYRLTTVDGEVYDFNGLANDYNVDNGMVRFIANYEFDGPVQNDICTVVFSAPINRVAYIESVGIEAIIEREILRRLNEIDDNAGAVVADLLQKELDRQKENEE